MAKTRRTTVAGSLVIEAVYPRKDRSDTPKERAAKEKLSSEAQRRMNATYSWMKLMLMLAANFRRGDMVVELDYRPDREPANRAQASARIKAFRKRLREYRRKHGGHVLVMFWNIEHLHGEGHWHHHCVINACGEDINVLLRLWGEGRFYSTPLRIDKDKGWESLARYMCKEEREKVGARTWSYTRGAAKPETDTCRVSDDYALQAPRGSRVLHDEKMITEYGGFRLLWYLAPGWDSAARAKGLHKRKR